MLEDGGTGAPLQNGVGRRVEAGQWEPLGLQVCSQGGFLTPPWGLKPRGGQTCPSGTGLSWEELGGGNNRGGGVPVTGAHVPIWHLPYSLGRLPTEGMTEAAAKTTVLRFG